MIIDLTEEQQFAIETNDGRLMVVKKIDLETGKNIINYHQIKYIGDVHDIFTEEIDRNICMVVHTTENCIFELENEEPLII